LLDNYVRKLVRNKDAKSSQEVVNFFHEQKLQEKPRSKKLDDDDVPPEDEEQPEQEIKPDKQPEEKPATEVLKESDEEYEFPEDQEVTGIVIAQYRRMSDHVLYQIKVSNAHKRSSFDCWTVLKRFGQFWEMDQKLRADLQQSHPDVFALLPLPPPRRMKLLYDHMDEDFIEERRVLMENYLQRLLRFPDAAGNKHFLDFLSAK